ncbi:hypothetical protein ACUXP2_000898 [Staphylococcus haemolyticus]|uniref:Uncharacterized protein n=1 Tax=Staphylococcus haemolyticus (strain JCSC1435) TaxID=279808 RepID=Q4LAJ5_STAHJ|nr:unnamed protein product [Staphylococcus haemolyticus JCSC1435]
MGQRWSHALILFVCVSVVDKHGIGTLIIGLV